MLAHCLLNLIISIQSVDVLLQRDDEKYCFKFHRDRVYYARESLAKQASTITRKHLLSFGSSLGRFNKKGVFKLHITALDYLAPYAKYRIWVKPSAEQQFLYGQHVSKSGLAKMTEDTPQYAGVIVQNMNDLPIGFGASAKSSLQSKNTDPMTICVFHQADLGEYIRDENSIA
ncbi:ribosome biosynthesis protein nip7 [Cichlidogyrus casuarinus]|uniref:60S ribosome subunit biogenesis protein NIP7 homolog n=1 Tax=Cichlidogyrus casuarinus TaxID=1844966 RepID=A0ABD2QL40_9PLAT